MAKMVRIENLGGRSDAVAELGITAAQFTKLLKADGAGFPDPVGTINGTIPVYDLGAVRDWKARDARVRRASVVSVPVTVGIKLHHVNRDTPIRFDAVAVDGGIEYAGTVYASPSAAGMAAAGYPVNGWTFWRTTDGDASLDSLRTA